MYMHTDRPDMQGQALHAHPDPTCQTLHDRPYMTQVETRASDGHEEHNGTA